MAIVHNPSPSQKINTGVSTEWGFDSLTLTSIMIVLTTIPFIKYRYVSYSSATYLYAGDEW